MNQIYAELTLYSLKFDNQRTQLGNERLRITNPPGKGSNVRLRVYSPLQSWFDKTWRFGEFELIK